MTRFYDSRDETDLARVESLLHAAGIEYAVAAPAGAGIREIEIAEEDLPRAEELLLQAAQREARPPA